MRQNFRRRAWFALTVIVMGTLGISSAWAANFHFVSSATTTPEDRTVSLFRSEFQARFTEGLLVETAFPRQAAGADIVVLGTPASLRKLLPAEVRARWEAKCRSFGSSTQPEAFSVVSVGWKKHPVLIMTGDDERGELFAVGWLLRTLRVRGGAAVLPRSRAFKSVPEKPVRGYQIGYRMKNNTYDAWTLSQFEQQMRDLAVFGMNTVQVIAPVSDDAESSPLYKASPMTTIVGLSKLSKDYGLRFDLYYPELKSDYTSKEQTESELKTFEDLVKALPLVDSLHVPGGDPGHTPPDVLFALVENEAVILHRYHPKATVWVSAQGFDSKRYEEFYQLLRDKPSWLTGVFFGPQSRDSLASQRQRIPDSLQLEFYPDIGHTMHSQFPVPEWDPIYALTEGREPICPRPAAFTQIYRNFARYHSGFMLYSEGVNDDVNKFLWAELGWSSTANQRETLVEYARYLLRAPSDTIAAQIADSIERLERNWQGPLLSNSGVGSELLQLRNLSASVPDGWRWNSLMYRGIYDRYVQVKRTREQAAEEKALMLLQQEGTSEQRSKNALAALNDSSPDPKERDLRKQLFAFAQKLYDEVGLQLSVPLYGASNWERGANLDRVDTPLNDRVWLATEFKHAMQGTSEAERLERLKAIAFWQKPAPGSFYDDLGDPSAEPHLVRGKGWAADPEMYETAIDGIADKTLEKGWRLSWLSYAETLYETPLELRYNELKTGTTYQLRVTYAGEDYHLPMRLVANGSFELQPYSPRKTNPQTVTYAIPAALTSSGTLRLEWRRPPGIGGGGRGGQVAEVGLEAIGNERQTSGVGIPAVQSE